MGRAVISPVCCVRGSTADWWRRCGWGESPGRLHPAHSPGHIQHLTTTRCIYHPLTNDKTFSSTTMPNPKMRRGEASLIFNTYQPVHARSYLLYTHICSHCLTHDSKLPKATADSSHPTANCSKTNKKQSSQWNKPLFIIQQRQYLKNAPRVVKNFNKLELNDWFKQVQLEARSKHREEQRHCVARGGAMESFHQSSDSEQSFFKSFSQW